MGRHPERRLGAREVVDVVVRGGIYWADLEPVSGHEQGGRRPVVVVQNDVGNRFSPTTIVACITSKNLKPYPFVVELPEGLLPQPSFINCAHLRTLDTSRLHPTPLAVLDAEAMGKVVNAVRISLGMA